MPATAHRSLSIGPFPPLETVLSVLSVAERSSLLMPCGRAAGWCMPWLHYWDALTWCLLMVPLHALNRPHHPVIHSLWRVALRVACLPEPSGHWAGGRCIWPTSGALSSLPGWLKRDWPDSCFYPFRMLAGRCRISQSMRFTQPSREEICQNSTI